MLEKGELSLYHQFIRLHHCSAHPGTAPSLLLWVFIPQTQGVLLAQDGRTWPAEA